MVIIKVSLQQALIHICSSYSYYDFPLKIMDVKRVFPLDLKLHYIVVMMLMMVINVPDRSVVALRVAPANDDDDFSQLLNSDSYSEEMYQKLVEEYEMTGDDERLGMKAKGVRKNKSQSADADDAHDLEEGQMRDEEEEDPEINAEHLEEMSQDNKDETNNGEGEPAERTTTESYRDAIKRLQCDNPWFWNSFKCLWLDVRKRNFIERTKSNAITVAVILGPPTLIALWFVCGFIIVAVFVRARIKQVQRKIEDLRNRYEPGKITLFDGTVKHYPPTKEETEAFEDLISALVSLV